MKWLFLTLVPVICFAGNPKNKPAKKPYVPPAFWNYTDYSPCRAFGISWDTPLEDVKTYTTALNESTEIVVRLDTVRKKEYKTLRFKSADVEYIFFYDTTGVLLQRVMAMIRVANDDDRIALFKKVSSQVVLKSLKYLESDSDKETRYSTPCGNDERETKVILYSFCVAVNIETN